MRIAREGRPFLLATGIPAVAVVYWASQTNSTAVQGLGILLLVLTGFIAFFFRDPERDPPTDPGAILASGDGRVVAIDSVEDAWVGDAIKVSVFLSIFNVHVNRTPCAGRVDQVAHIPGRFRLAFVDKASDDNERTEIALDGSCGRVIVKQIAGFVARRIVCHLTPQQQVEAGERFGLIRFGSRVDHIVSAKADIRVTINDRVRGGETVIGVLTP
jgi:phosphatidylserine decarboxylase